MARQISLAQFRHRMRRADQRLVRTLSEKLKDLGLKAEAYAKRNATDFPRVRTGRLRSSITPTLVSDAGQPKMILTAGGSTKGAPVRYARFVEFGTKRMRPRLFFGRAMQKIERSDTPKELRDLLKLALVED